MSFTDTGWKPAHQHLLKAPSLWKRNKARVSCECSALSKNAACSVRMRAGGSTRMTGIWRMPLLSQSQFRPAPAFAVAPPLKHAEPLCWQGEVRWCNAGERWIDFHYVGRSYLPARLRSLSPSSKAQRWLKDISARAQSCRCTSPGVRVMLG